MLHALCLCLAAGAPAPPVLAPAPAVVRGADDELEALARELTRANATWNAQRRKQVLQAIVAKEDDDGIEVLQGEFAIVSRRLRDLASSLRRDRYTLERRVIQLEEMKVRADADPSLKHRVPELANEVTDLRLRIETTEEGVEAEGAAADDLGAAVEDLFAVFGPAKQRQLEKAIWKTAEEDDDLGIRLGAIELLGRMGGPGTAVRLQKQLSESIGDAAKLRRKLPKLMKEVREMEARVQEDIERNNGGLPQDTAQLYQDKKREAADLRREVNLLEHIADACAESGGLALSREPSEQLDKSLQALVKAQARGKDGARTDTLDLLAKAGGERVLAALRELLAEEEEPAARATLIDGLAAAGDVAIAEALFATHLLDETWHVRSRAVAACARLRLKDAIPVLIARLEVETGRVKTDVVDALESLTGQKLGTLPQRWTEWWGDHGATFEVPPLVEDVDLVALAQEGIGVSFFGIRTDSEKVLFIIDTSGSMNFPMYLKSGTGQPTREGETRLSVAKRELIKALGGIPDGGVFNIVPYASDVRRYQGDDPIGMDRDARSEAIAWVEGLTAIGGTNVYGVLETALELAGTEAGDRWSEPDFDTIFFLSDGIPQGGLTEDPDEILAMVRERNRSAGIVIHTIGLSAEHDVYLMRSLAEQNGGKYAAR